MTEKGRLLVVRGSGEAVEVDPVAAAAEDGPLGEVMCRLVRDPELRADLRRPDAVIEQYVEGDDGVSSEHTLSRFEQWRDVYRQVKEGNRVELGVAQRHIGGRRISRRGASHGPRARLAA